MSVVNARSELQEELQGEQKEPPQGPNPHMEKLNAEPLGKQPGAQPGPNPGPQPGVNPGPQPVVQLVVQLVVQPGPNPGQKPGPGKLHGPQGGGFLQGPLPQEGPQPQGPQFGVPQGGVLLNGLDISMLLSKNHEADNHQHIRIEWHGIKSRLHNT